MGKVKKIIAGLVAVSLAAGGAAGGLSYMKKSNQKEVQVTSVSNLASTYYMPATSLDGMITTSVSQNVSLDKDMIIDQVFVQKGDNVKIGDPLISFDMTLVEMELNIERLRHQKQERDLNKAVNRLNSLKNGGPILEEDINNPGTADNLNDMDWEDYDDMASLTGEAGGHLLAAVIRPIFLAAFTATEPEENAGESKDGFPDIGDMEEDIYQEPEETPEDPFGDGVNKGDSVSDGFESGVENDSAAPQPTPTPIVEKGTDVFDPYPQGGNDNLTDGEEPFYQKLDGDTKPFYGTGSKEDPYIFLCSSAKGYVTGTGAFFNKMAGYTEDGTKLVHKGGYWYQLEFHEGDKIADYGNRKESCTGYYLVNGKLLKQPVYMYSEMKFSLEGASQYDEEPDYDDPPDDGFGGDDMPPMSRKEAIKIQQDKIAGLKLDIQESDITISKLEKKVNRKEVFSKLDGTVAYVGDAVTGSSDGDAFIKVKNSDGYFVRGTVSELMLDQVKEGTLLKCMSYEIGEFEAEVMEVSDYPVNANSYYGDGNPNVSNYSFTASIPDKSLKVRDGDWITVNLKEETSDGDSIVLDKAFVRTKDGTSYVYKDDNGVLKKQVLTVGGVVNSGYSVLIKGGITLNDKIAFPYGKTVQEGVKTKEVSVNEFYGY